MATSSGDTAETQFACRKCRRVLFGASQLEDHQPARHDFSKRKLKAGASKYACSSYFLAERALWMGDMGDVEGKIVCATASCGARLGSYKWAGSQCSCGTWVTPAIQITGSRVDERLPMASGVDTPGAVVHASVLKTERLGNEKDATKEPPPPPTLEQEEASKKTMPPAAFPPAPSDAAAASKLTTQEVDGGNKTEGIGE